MKTPIWTKNELVVYILLFAAHSDFKEDNHERNVIISKVDIQTFQKIHDEFSADNDYQSIQKILSALKAHKYSEEDVNILITDIKILFFSDSDFNILERNMLKFLTRLLQS